MFFFYDQMRPLKLSEKIPYFSKTKKETKMTKKTTKYINFPASDELYERIGRIQRVLSEKLSMSVSRAYVCRLILQEGIASLESATT